MDNNTPIDRIKVEIIADSSKAINEINNFASALKNLQSLSNNKNLVPEFSSKSTNQLSNLISQSKELNSTDLSSFISQVNSATNAVEKLNSASKVNGNFNFNGFSNVNFSGGGKIPSLPSGADSNSQSSNSQLGFWRGPRLTIPTPDTNSSNANRWEQLGAEIGAKVGTAINTGARTALSALGSIARPVFSVLESGFAKVGSVGVLAFKTIGSEIVKLSVSPFTALGKSVMGVTSKIRSLAASVIRIAKFRIIRTLIKGITKAFKEGINNAFQYSKALNGTFAKSLNMLSTSALYVKNSLGAMTMPLINKIAPAIDYIADKFVAFVNLINENLAKAFGQSTWTKAIKIPQQYGEETDKAKESTDELKRSILSFDEIHALNGNDSSNSSSSKASNDHSKMFTTEKVSSNSLFDVDWSEIQKKAVDFANKLGDKINKAIKKINWKKVGYTIAEMFNTVVLATDALVTRIKWDKFGKALATSANKFVSTSKWKNIGKILADGFNAVASFMGNFAYNFNWTAFGKGLAESLRKFVSTIKLNSAANALATTIKGVCKTAIELFKSPSWGKLGTKIRTALIKFFGKKPFTSISTTIREAFGAMFDFANKLFKKDENGDSVASKLGDDVGTAINKWFKDKKWWRKAGMFVGRVAEGLTDFLVHAIGKIDMNEVVSAIVEFLKAIPFWDIAAKLGEAIAKALFSAIWDVGVQFISGFVSLAGKNAVDTLKRKLSFEKQKILDSMTLPDNVSEQIFDPKDKISGTNKYYELIQQLGNDIGQKFAESGINGVSSYLKKDFNKGEWKKAFGKKGDEASKAFSDGGLSGLNDWYKKNKSVLTAKGDKAGKDITKATKKGAESISLTETGEKKTKEVTTGMTSKKSETNVIKDVASLNKTILNNFKDTPFKGKGESFTDKLSKGINSKDSQDKAKSSSKELGDKVKSNLISALGNPLNIGGTYIVNIIQGLWNGLTKGNLWNGFVEHFKNKFGGLVQGVKDLLKIKSPSKVFLAIGKNIVLGLRNGIADNSNTVFDTAKTMINGMTKTFDNAQFAIPTIRTNTVIDSIGKYSVSIDDTALTLMSNVSDNYAEQNMLLRQQNELLRKIYQKSGDSSSGVRTSDVIVAFARKNTREGKTVVPLGV